MRNISLAAPHVRLRCTLNLRPLLICTLSRLTGHRTISALHQCSCNVQAVDSIGIPEKKYETSLMFQMCALVTLFSYMVRIVYAPHPMKNWEGYPSVYECDFNSNIAKLSASQRSVGGLGYKDELAI